MNYSGMILAPFGLQGYRKMTNSEITERVNATNPCPQTFGPLTVAETRERVIEYAIRKRGPEPKR